MRNLDYYEKQIIQLIRESLPRHAVDMEIGPNTNIFCDLNLDSFSILQLVIELEIFFDIKLDMASLKFAENQTVSGLAGIIMK